MLSYPLPNGSFILEMDASNAGIGGVQFQLQNGHESVIDISTKFYQKPNGIIVSPGVDY